MTFTRDLSAIMQSRRATSAAEVGLGALFPGIPTKEAYTKLLAHVLERTLGEPMPSRDALARGEYPRFPTVAALNAAFYGGARG